MSDAASLEREGNAMKVFVIHGYDEAKRRELKDLLENHFKRALVVMQDQPGKSRTFIEKFEHEAEPCEAAIAILTPDDVVLDEKGELKSTFALMQPVGLR